MKYKLDDYKVGEIANFYGVSGDTIRFYDRKGVLQPEKKGDNNYRSYSKEEFIIMDYIMRMRSLGISIENIKKMVVSTTLQDSLEIVTESEAEIEMQIKELEHQRQLIRGYKAKLKDCAQAYGKVTLEQSPIFLVRDIKNNNMKDTMEAFSRAQIPTLPLLGVLIDGEAYDSLELYHKFLDRVERQKICDYVVIASDYQNLCEQEGFPREEFKIIPSRRCVHIIGMDHTNIDYSSIKPVYDFIQQNHFKISAPPVLLFLTLENRGEDGIEYTEIWVPVE